MSADREPRVSVILGGTLAAQTVAALFWAGSAAERLSQLEARLDDSAELRVRVARLEEGTEHIQTTLVRIETKIDAVRAGDAGGGR